HVTGVQTCALPISLTGKIALVTGSAGGIGKAIAKKLAGEGACVVLNDINDERLKGAVEEFTKTFGKDAVGSVNLDVTSETSARQAFRQAALMFGGVDIIVNNAGISISKSIADHSLEEWDRLYDILVKGQFVVS